jgi:hypothetical protein
MRCFDSLVFDEELVLSYALVSGRAFDPVPGEETRSTKFSRTDCTTTKAVFVLRFFCRFVQRNIYALSAVFLLLLANRNQHHTYFCFEVVECRFVQRNTLSANKK